MFDAHYEYEMANRSTKMIDMAQAAIYAQATNDSRSKMWNMWTSTITRIKHAMNLQHNDGERSTITWNGEPIDKKKLMKMFQTMFGRRSVE